MGPEVEVRTDVPGADAPLIERGTVVQYMGNGAFAVRMDYGTITVESDRLTAVGTLADYLDAQGL